jgi:hypothetical protein
MEDYTWLKEAIERDAPIFYGEWQIEQLAQNLLLEKEINRYFSNAGLGSKNQTMSDEQKPSMRAKFRCDEVTNYGYGGHQKVKMNALYSSKRNTEDNQFSEATPSGSLEMMISAKGAIDFLKPGVKYILTFQEADDQE